MKTSTKSIFFIALISFSVISWRGVSQSTSWVRLGDIISGDEDNDLFGNSVSINSDGSIIAIGAPLLGGKGKVRIYENSSGNWIQIGNDIEGQDNDFLGTSVSLSANGDIVAFTIPGADLVRIYQNLSGNWVQVGGDIVATLSYSNTMSNTSIISLNTDGTKIAVASGNVSRIYQNILNVWTQTGTDISTEGGFPVTSISLNADGSTVAVGVANNNGNGAFSGHTRVFENISDNWTQIGEDIDSEASGDQSGFSVSLSADGSIVAIGAPRNDAVGTDAGHVRVFENVSGSWLQLGSDIDADNSFPDFTLFGESVSIRADGMAVAIGAPLSGYGGGRSGKVTVYEFTSSDWSQVGNVLPLNGSFTEYGTSLDISDNDIVLVGGPTDITGSNNNPGTAVVLKPKTTQTITFEELANRTFGDSPFNLTATASSGLEVSYGSSDETVAIISGATVSILSAGSIVITASQAGDDDFIAAPDVEQTLTIDKGDQEITFGPIDVRTFGDPNFDLNTSGGNSGNPVTFSSSNEGVATVTGNTVNIIGAGSTLITANQAGNDNYNSAMPVEQALSINKANQSITFEELSNRTFGDDNFELIATASSSLTVNYSSSNEEVATITANTVQIVGAGETNITASQSGNGNYNSASNVVQTLTVDKADQVINITTIDDKTTTSPPFDVVANVDSGQPLTYSIQSGPATISENTITLNGTVGTVVVEVNQPGNTNYNESSETTSFEIIQGGTPEITVAYTSNLAKGENFDLGGVVTGSTTSNFFMITNTGDANLILNGTPSVSISDPDLGFSVSTMPDITTLAAGESTTFSVEVSPTTTGVFFAEVSIPTNDSEANPFTFQLEVLSFEPSACSIPQGGMETSYKGSLPLIDLFSGNPDGLNTYEAPGGWSPVLSLLTGLFGADINIRRTDDVRSGNQALELFNSENGMGDLVTVFPCANEPASLRGYYKFTGAEVDSAIVAISSGGGVETNRTAANSDTLYLRTNADSYTEFNMDFTYDELSVDSLLIYVATTTNGNNTSFKLDDLELVFEEVTDNIDNSPVVNIPDPNFKAALVSNPNINANNDQEIQVSEAEVYNSTLNIPNREITSLEGISAFTSIIGVDCSSNQLTSIDVSLNPNLEFFFCSNNQLTELNVKNGNNVTLSDFRASSNPNLSCIQVDNVDFSQTNWTDIDPTASFSTDCSQFVTGLDESEVLEQLMVYPNPASDFLYLEWSGDRTLDIRIYDLLGSTRLRDRIQPHQQIDISHFQSGTYLIRIFNLEGRLLNNLRFVKD